MHSNVTVKNVSWPHFSWPTLYMFKIYIEFFDLPLYDIRCNLL